MVSKVLRRQSCGIGGDCPEVQIDSEGGDVKITGYKLGAKHVAENEVTIEVPATLVPELSSLDIPNFRAYRDALRKTPGDIYRVQTLSQYGVPSDDDDYQRYMHGGEPQSPYREPWFAELREDRDAGRAYRNLHVVNGPISNYLRYQFEWAYAYNVENGQDVRILDVAEYPAGAALLRTGDYWVLEHAHVVLCRYDEEGHPLGAVAVEAAGAGGFITAAEMAWQLGTPFTAWWNSHPEFHRVVKRAA
jgi:hypothetical protein